jgi:hypothetical protein
MPYSLTKYELQLVTDPAVIITKNKIIKSVIGMMGEISEEYKGILANTALKEQVGINAKIARGENYRGLPYVIMDLPRAFSKEHVLAIRSFFWWGNFFSITLHLSGDYYQQHRGSILKAVENNLLSNWYINNSEDQWQHHFEDDNYIPVTASEVTKLPGKSFIKLAKKIPLNKWDEVEVFFKESFSQLIKMLTG